MTMSMHTNVDFLMTLFNDIFRDWEFAVGPECFALLPLISN
jgi:hypothetical protein